MAKIYTQTEIIEEIVLFVIVFIYKFFQNTKFCFLCMEF
jgi:hypothetical protein